MDATVNGEMCRESAEPTRRRRRENINPGLSIANDYQALVFPVQSIVIGTPSKQKIDFHSMLLTGTALVGGSEIGQDYVFAFSEAGCKVVAVADINLENAYSTAQTSKRYASNDTYHSFGIHVDVVNEDDFRKMVQKAVEGIGGRIDYFVNCAGTEHVQVPDI
ncbi:hypothetical protein BDV96DRAFT_593641 [Lophiotrema nucula]|uniref:Uncharacterized protein n=1 Tax=Lophiotrema nucula TaxID=690887 RepID=A0A6A5ZU76_9PLEO|nr:hypothetical protein BDV96DRAFT_593641 [Lophiotrema nucula]